MSEILSMRMELGQVTDGEGNPFADEAIIFFGRAWGSPEICISTPDAAKVAARIVELWNAAIPLPERATQGE